MGYTRFFFAVIMLGLGVLFVVLTFLTVGVCLLVLFIPSFFSIGSRTTGLLRRVRRKWRRGVFWIDILFVGFYEEMMVFGVCCSPSELLYSVAIS